MLYLIIYDISTDSIRNKIAKILIEASFERLQLSVFLGLENPKKDKRLWERLNENLKEEKDAKFYILPVPKSSLNNMISIGKNELDIKYLTGDKDSLFF